MPHRSLFPWQVDVGVREQTDRDLQQARDESTRISDSSFELHRYLETLRRQWEFDDWSATVDRVLRVELAHAIDEYEVDFTHEDYDVAYTVPPLDWLPKTYEETSLCAESAVDTSDRGVNVSTSPVVYEMAREAVEQGAYESVTAMVKSGAQRQLGLV